MRRLFVACSIVLSAIGLALLAGPAMAQVSPELAAWADGPEGLLLTEPERQQLQALQTDAEVEQFIELFWARRDPDPSTRDNEARRDFNLRVAAADKQLAEGETRGALTARGRALILLGAPGEHMTARLGDYLAHLYNERPGSGDTGASSLDATVRIHGVTFNSAKGRADIWTYGREQIPAGIELPKRATSVEMGFVDLEGDGVFVLDPKVRKTSRAIEVLDAVAATLVLHPGLTELPIYPLLEGKEAATAEQLAWLDADELLWPDGAGSLVTSGMSLSSVLPAWIALLLPEDVGSADTLFGRLTASDGPVVGTFQSPVEAVSVAGGTLYELSLPGAAGSYTLDIGLAAGGKLLAARSEEIELVELEEGVTYISEMVAGAEVMQLESFEALEPFVFGGYHLVPRPQGTYDYGDTINFFCFLVNPGRGESDQQTAAVERRLYFGKQRSPRSPAEEVQLSEVAPGTYMYGSQLPLSGMPVGGEYKLKLTMSDPVSGAEQVSEIKFVLPEKAQ